MPGEQEDDSRRHKITRIRPFLSCTECIRRKVKCDRNKPCGACKSRSKRKECLFPASLDQTFSPSRHAEFSQIPSPKISSRVKRKRQRSEHDWTEPESSISSSLSRNGRSWQDRGNPSEDRSDGRYTEHAVKDMEDYLTAGAMSAKWTLSSQNNEGDSQSVLPPSESVIERLTAQQCISSHRSLYDQVLNSLPNRKEALHCLVARYFSNVAWHWHILHRQSFLEEYEAFGVLLDRGELPQVDPLWIACLFGVLAHAANSFDEVDEVTGMFFQAIDLADLPDQFARAAGSALECGDWLGKARIRSIQALSLLSTYLIFNAAPSAIERLGLYCICAMRMCQELGIHLLSDDPTKMPLPDPAFPQRPSLLKREISLRLFYNCLTLDLLQHRHRPFMDPSDVTCGLPGNYDDDHLSFDTEDVPRPAPSLTESAIDILRYESAKMQREWLDVVRRDKIPSDEVLLDIDQRLVQVHNRYALGDMPPDENRQKTWSKLISVYNLHVRRMRFHRPFIRSRQNCPTQISLRNAVEDAAKGLMIAATELFRLGAPLARGSFFLLHLQSAVVVLVQSSWYTPESAKEHLEDELIRNVHHIFQHYAQSLRVQVRRAARIGARTIKLLIETVEDRRSFAGSHESFIHALKRIGDTVKRAERAQGPPAHLDTQDLALVQRSVDTSILLPDPELEAWMFAFMSVCES
ncbi:uncharacterized protein IL334_004523 [Kwoniella shivajii]|uniref:Zn(2)-C6 fungal-type domain-containing protein n=1 Tax=Kwoniella shivajii TaxID=564305 RepID=A0ABZ1D3K1_9TREE|nr:hypothetical protein IL334_004523 [Kwoniella shivajii]